MSSNVCVRQEILWCDHSIETFLAVLLYVLYFVFVFQCFIITFFNILIPFQLLLSTSYFWRNYINHNFDFNDDDNELLTGMLHELGSTWFFGWGQGMVQGLSEGDLFEEFPRRWKSGIVHPVGPDVRSNVEDYKSFYEALYQLQKLQSEVDDRDIVYSK